MSTTTLITADQFDEMSFDRPVELIQGEIVEMTGAGTVHGCVCANVTGILWNWARLQNQFIVSSNDPGIQTQSAPDSIRCPDVAIIKKESLVSGGIPSGRLTVPPEVAIEVKSPSNSWRELIAKSAEFLAVGVNEVWIVDPESRHVHVFQNETEPTILGCNDTITSESLPEFSCHVSEFFRNVTPESEP